MRNPKPFRVRSDAPESYSSNEAKNAALQAFIQNYSTVFPNNNPRDLMIFRYHLLVQHSCVQTLKAMLASVAPLSTMLSFDKADYGPQNRRIRSGDKGLDGSF